MSVLIRGICHKCHAMNVVAASIDHERYYCDKCNPEIIPLQVVMAEEGKMSNGVIFIGKDAKPCTVCGKSITERFYSYKDCLRDARCRQCNDKFEGARWIN